MAVQPILTPRFRALDANGVPLAGGLLYAYSAGTTTPRDTFTARDGLTANSNPVVLDANGEADIWVTSGVLYKFVLKDSAGVTQWTEDNVPSAGIDLSLEDGSAGAPGLAFVSDPDSGLFRIGANDIGFSTGGVLIQEWSPTTVLFGKGITVTQSGAGNGVTSTGGTSSGSGLKGTGGAPNGIGVEGVGVGTGNGVKGSSAGPTAGVYGTASDNAGIGVEANVSSNGTGVKSVTTGAGTAGVFTAAGTGRAMQLTGNATGAPLRIIGMAAAPSSPADGDIYYDTTIPALRCRVGGAWVNL